VLTSQAGSTPDMRAIPKTLLLLLLLLLLPLLCRVAGV
jgi:hypothetical protein